MMLDLYTNDIGLTAIIENHKLTGFNVAAGGGMGATHGNKETYPRLASVLVMLTKTTCLK